MRLLESLGMVWSWVIASWLMLAPPAPAPRARVLFFVATDCPYSDRYFPEMLRLRNEFAGRGVTITWVYPNRYERLATAQAHQQAFGAPAASVDLDTDGKLARASGIHITPEAAVLAPDQAGAWITEYHGRIDDRYVRIGLERAHAEHHDLENAIESVLAGKHPLPPDGSAIGCSLVTAKP